MEHQEKKGKLERRAGGKDSPSATKDGWWEKKRGGDWETRLPGQRKQKKERVPKTEDNFPSFLGELSHIGWISEWKTRDR